MSFWQAVFSTMLAPLLTGDGFRFKSGSHANDADLIEAISARNESAFELFYDRYAGLVYSLVLQILEDAGLAEDVTLEVFSRVWEQAGSYRSSRANVKTWLLSIARYRAIDLIRKRRRRLDGNLMLWADEELERLTGEGNPERDATHSDMLEKVLHALMTLPEEQRLPLALAYFKGLSHSEIAEHLQEPLGTIKGRIRNAMRRLQDKFADEA